MSSRSFPWICLLILILLFPIRLPAQKPPLRVGMELSYPPFEMTDTEGKPTGVSVDLAQAMGTHLQREVVIENIAFDGLIPSLKTGKIDLILSSMTATEERARTVDFSTPYLSTGLCLLLPANSTVTGIQDLDNPGKTIAVKKGTTGHVYASTKLKSKLLVLDKESAAVLEVAQGSADAFIYDQMSVYKHWQKNPQRLKPLLEPFQKESWAIAVKKGDDRLREEINEFLAKFKADGGFEQLGDRYLKEQKEAFTKLGIGFYF